MSIKSAARFLDQSLAELQLRVVGEKNSLLTFLFHTIYTDESEISLDIVDPLLGLTLADFRQSIEYFQQHGYEFVSPTRVLNGLPAGKFALITFDDGYYNNLRVLPILEATSAPAIFFISTNHVRENRAYWWDVLYRNSVQRGRTAKEHDRMVTTIKEWRHEKIEDFVKRECQVDTLSPKGDLDRPLTPSELQEFANHELVYIGNHTSDHALLTNYDAAGVRQQISQAQTHLTEMIGQTPRIISYPNGNYNAEVSKIAREEGLEMGITVVGRKNPLPFRFTGLQLMELGRFMISPSDPLIEQCLGFRSDVRLIARAKQLFGLRN